jgi:hypothetical protein
MCREKCKFKISVALLMNAFGTDFHIVSRLRMSGAIPLLPPTYFHGVDRENFTFTLCRFGA